MSVVELNSFVFKRQVFIFSARDVFTGIIGIKTFLENTNLNPPKVKSYT